MTEHMFNVDAYAPAEMAQRVATAGVSKGNLDPATMFALAVLAGAFIALGGNVATIALTHHGLGYGVSRLLGGLVFSLGLILVIVGGAELFTGNNLIVMAWASGTMPTSRLLRNWGIVYLGNFVGALGTAVGVYVSRQWTFDAYHVGATALTIAHAKVQYDFLSAFALGAFGNALVCLAVWLCFSARTTTDKIVAIVPPITAFVAAGFEHSVANMYFIPLGLWLRDHPHVSEVAGHSLEQLADLTWRGFFVNNLIPVTLGNLFGGTIMVAAVYWFVYLRCPPKHRAGPHD
ncbi:MAG: formate/nitrite transporter family protein [Candidatus Entotheonellia bacterium]